MSGAEPGDGAGAVVSGHGLVVRRGGQLARVGLAVALLGSPDLLVLDEPTVGL